MKSGFRFAEKMTGTYARCNAPQNRRPFSFSAEVVVESVREYLRHGTAELSGTLEADGFADHVPIDGTLTIAPVRQRMIRYEFDFTGNDGNPYRFVGQKDLRLRDLVTSLTRLPGAIFDAAGQQVAECETQFNLRSDAIHFLTSFRPA